MITCSLIKHTFTHVNGALLTAFFKHFIYQHFTGFTIILVSTAMEYDITAKQMMNLHGKL